MEHELLAAVALLENVTARDIGRQQVGRELDAAEVERQEARQGLDELGLAKARQALQQDVSPREQGRDDLVDRLFLAEDDAAQLGDDPGDFRLTVDNPLGRDQCSVVSGHRRLTVRSTS